MNEKGKWSSSICGGGKEGGGTLKGDMDGTGEGGGVRFLTVNMDGWFLCLSRNNS